jgi:hypothetical protein
VTAFLNKLPKATSFQLLVVLQIALLDSNLKKEATTQQTQHFKIGRIKMTTTNLFPPSPHHHDNNKLAIVSTIYDDRVQDADDTLAKVIDSTVTAWEASSNTCVLIHVIAVSNSLPSSSPEINDEDNKDIETMIQHRQDGVTCINVIFDALKGGGDLTELPNSLKTRCFFSCWKGRRSVGHIKGH